MNISLQLVVIRRSTIFFSILFFVFLSIASQAEIATPTCVRPTISKHIKLGMSTALSGPTQYLGLAMLHGVRQRLDEENCSEFWRAKGISFDLIALDDSYEPEVAETNAHALIDQHIIAFIGNVGTPTAERVWPIADKAGVIFYGAYTGTSLLRLNPSAVNVFNYRASYDQEMESIMAHIIGQGISIQRIGLFLQNDAFGHAGLASIDKTLKNICGDCKNQILQMRYERNTLKINDALKVFVEANLKLDAVILVGASEPSAAFIEFAHRISPTTRFYSLSFTGASALKARLGNTSAQVLMSQVVPSYELPANQHIQLVNNVAHNANLVIAESMRHLNEVEREGYLATELFLNSARTIQGDITSDSLRKSLLRTERTLNPSASVLDHQMQDYVWLTKLAPSFEPTPATKVDPENDKNN